MGGIKQNDGLNKHVNQSSPGMDEGLLDKLIEGHNRSIAGTPDSTNVILPGSRLVEDSKADHNGSDSSTLPTSNLTISSAKKSPVSSSKQ